MTHDDPDGYYETIVAQLLTSHDRRNETSSGIAETRVRQAAFEHDRKVVLMAMGWGSSEYERDGRGLAGPFLLVLLTGAICGAIATAFIIAALGHFK